MKNKGLIKTALIILLICVLAAAAPACSSSSFIPGASFGYFIWQDSSSKIHIAWSAERKDARFEGRIETDGFIDEFIFSGDMESEAVSINEQKNRIDFYSRLSAANYTEKIIIDVRDYTYIEFDLKIDDAYDLARINLGRFLNSPAEGVFRIGGDYFTEIKNMPLYKAHPFAGFLYKLGKDINFTVFYMFILGIIAIEIIRITAIRRRKKYNWYLLLCYGALIFVIVLVYFFLRMIV